VTLNGTPLASTGPTATFNVPNGTYPYSVAAPSGYAVLTKFGNVTVDDGAAGVPVTFSSTSPPAPSVTIPWLYVGVGVGALVIVVVAVIALRRRGPARDREPPVE